MSRLGALLAAAALVACGSASNVAPEAGLIHGSGKVSVMFAGSLTQLFEQKLAPAFKQATGFGFEGEGKGSVAIANLIRDGARAPDVFVSADPTVNRTLQGQANGEYVRWWVDFAATEMVIAWSPKSRFRADFEAARNGSRPWESVLEEKGLRLGRTDPELDPKGYRTLWLFQLDEQRTQEVGQARRILGPDRNQDQVFLEEQLVARLQTGQLDTGVFYQIEAVEAGLPYLRLPAEINQGDPALAEHYATVSYTNAKGVVFRGSPIQYTATIPRTVRNPFGARAFIQFLLVRSGRDLLRSDGLIPLVPAVEGDAAGVPAEIRGLLPTPK